MVEAIQANVLSASRLPKVIETWEEPKHEEFAPRTAWSLFNAFTEVGKSTSPRAQMEGKRSVMPTLPHAGFMRQDVPLTWILVAEPEEVAIAAVSCPDAPPRALRSP